jgi:ribosomal protein S18 acetylase RimI-like enzyme
MSDGRTNPMPITIRLMTPPDIPAVLDLWRASEGVYLGASDAIEQVTAYLARNPGLSLVALDGPVIVGAILCGHDGRRGFLHHLAVTPSYRRRGIGGAIVDRTIEGLQREGILRAHILVYADNATATTFWERLGWSLRDRLRIMTRDV